MIEALDAGPDQLNLVFCPRTRESSGGIQAPTRTAISGLKTPVWVLPYYTSSVLKRLGLERVYRELRQALFLAGLCRRKKVDLCYFNNGNLLIAALFAYLGVGRVVLRVMGAYPVMKEIAARRKTPAAWIEYKAYRAPYAHVVCTQDGSGGEWFMDRALRPEVPRTLMLNGVDTAFKERADQGIAKKRVGVPSERPLILFVGKMEPAKGCMEFLDAVATLAKERPDAFTAVMIGKGPQLHSAEERAKSDGLERYVRVIPSVPHRSIVEWHHAADIYVSMNLLGGLSNANLEAMRSGTCVVMLEGDRERHVDETTDHMLTEGCVVRIGRKRAVENLKEALKELLDNPEKRRGIGEKMARVAKELIPTWDERIQSELQLLQRVAAGERV
jgi:glycosyltransferase involved in cell wall biosynthesis